MTSTGANVNPNTLTEDAQGEQVNMYKLQQLEEEALKLKYPGTAENTTAFLHKCLQKGQKFFDSGDYQMAKQNCGVINGVTVGQEIPTPETLYANKSLIKTRTSN
ncbi:alpha-endosulfine-like [Glossina fuscipes]|uniref:Alpha-endosulfine-like n=1 Tax=Glossina fuscipes TaxID=7396 RepID=A0A9C6DXL2_9MUSC|nr:alpha-endosulfine-like [Glossina fuscipes]KAI9577556.1 hypothetical protein GQX74_005018 [Glossina fuscipes]